VSRQTVNFSSGPTPPQLAEITSVSPQSAHPKWAKIPILALP
jgi:hypothetical protein